MQRVALQFWHVGAARKKAHREAETEARRRLHEKLFSVRLRWCRQVTAPAYGGGKSLSAAS